MEMRRHPRRIVNHIVHGVAHVDEPAETTEAEHYQRQRDCQNQRLLPRQGPDPTQHPAAATRPSGDFQAGADREHREQRRQGDKECQERLQELEPSANGPWKT
jgi:hypothetical protein